MCYSCNLALSENCVVGPRASVLWSGKDGEAGDAEYIVDAAGRSPDQKKAARSLINRLVQKGAVTFKKDGRQHQYSPCVGEAECTHAEAKSFLRRVRVSAI